MAKRISVLAQMPQVSIASKSIHRMAREVEAMLKDALDATFSATLSWPRVWSSGRPKPTSCTTNRSASFVAEDIPLELAVES